MTIVGNEYMPYLIRVAVLIIIAASIYDFLRRRAAAKITETLKSLGALSPEDAVHISMIKKQLPRTELMFRLFLRKGSMLRRIVVCKDSCQSEAGSDKLLRKKKERSSSPDIENSSWYLICDTYSDSSNAEKENRTERKKYRSVGVLAREGAEQSVKSLILGLLLTVAAGELLIYFLPDIVSFFGKSGSLF